MIAEEPSSVLAAEWQRVVHPFVLRVFRVRFAILPALVVAFFVFLAFEPVPWKLVWVGATTLLSAVLFGFEYWRIRRSEPGIPTIQVNVAAALLLQTSMIFITGGIESPLLAVYVPFGLIAGLSLGKPSRVIPISLIPVVFTLFFATAATFHWLPNTTPTFFDLVPGFADRPVYVWTRAGVVVMITIIASSVGVGIRRSFEAIAQDMAEARQGILDVLASRNRDILSVASTVAHELKNPLTSIQGLAQLMARAAQPGTKDAERLDVMRREVARMTTVLDEFRNFSRPLSGLSLDKSRLRSLIRDVVVLNEGRADSRGVSLALREGDDVLLVCDPQKIRQAVLNLVQNALESTPPGGSVEVSLRLVAMARAEVSVRDTGPGLSPKIQDRLFTPGATTKEHGTGIGLVVARSIADQHGGTLRLANREPGGCEAVLSLPIRSDLPTQEASLS